jgi:hypothetical protein
MFTVESRVGRLLEVRSETLHTRAEVTQLFGMIRADLARRPRTESVVICADYRRLTVFPDDVADVYRSMLLQFNPRVARSAFIVSKDGALAQLQLSRLVREAENPERRVLRDVASIMQWLGEVLSPPERARIAQFLGV